MLPRFILISGVWQKAVIMDLNLLFEPLDLSHINAGGSLRHTQLGAQISLHTELFPDLDGVQVVLIGVPEERGSADNKGCAWGADIIRKELYQLEHNFELNIADLGNLIIGQNLQDTYAALEHIMAELLKNKIFCIILGGSQDLTYPQYCAYGRFNSKVDLLVIDSFFDLSTEIIGSPEINSSSYLNKIIVHEPDILFNYSNIGYQSYFVSQEMLRLMDKLCFDTFRLGELSGKIQEAEPIIRSANLLSFDLHALRFSDAPARAGQNPHGFYGEEACQLFRYAGMNEQLTSLGIYEFNPSLDIRNQTSQLLAQMLWYFLEGYSFRKQDNPLNSSLNFIRYRTSVASHPAEIIFYKSRNTGRWWLQVPYPERYARNEHFHLTPCTYQDYKQTCAGELPDRWWKTIQKL